MKKIFLIWMALNSFTALGNPLEGIRLTVIAKLSMAARAVGEVAVRLLDGCIKCRTVGGAIYF